MEFIAELIAFGVAYASFRYIYNKINSILY